VMAHDASMTRQPNCAGSYSSKTTQPASQQQSCNKAHVCNTALTNACCGIAALKCDSIPSDNKRKRAPWFERQFA
jgi:hypothetical protein